MFALLPSSAINPGYAGTPSLASSTGWGTRQSQKAATERRRVTIFRDSLDTPWGFRLQGGKDLNVPLSVKRVFSGSPADGQLTRDDLILAVNDQSVDDMTSAQVLEMIKSAGSSIVLTIETSPYDSAAFHYNYNPTRHTVHQEPAQPQKIQPATQETKTSSHDSHQSQPAVNYETSPQDYKRTTPANTYYPKAPVKSPHRSANRFQTASAIPSGMTEMGWTPRTKQVIKEPSSAVREPPVSQHRSARQQTKPPGSADSSWRSPYATVEESNVPAWHGSMRSSRTTHSVESRAARTNSSTNDELMHNLPAETRPQHQNARRVQDPSQSQTSHTYKAEIRGLMLARPSNQHAQSTSDWVDTTDRQAYRSPGQARSAPETPNADASDRTILSARQPVGPGQDNSSNQQSDDSAPAKLQPSLLFGARGANRAVQSPTQARVTLRSQPHETTVFTNQQQQREEVKAPAPQILPVPKIQQAVSAPRTVTAPQVPVQTRVAAAPAVIPYVVAPTATTPAHQRITVANANSAAAIPATQAQLTKIQPTVAKRVIQNPTVVYHQTDKIERFNPVPDRRDIGHNEKPTYKTKVDLIERFNPTPDRPEQKVINSSEKLAKTLASGSPVKFLQTEIECFNPTPDRPETISKIQQAAPKYPNTPVERFNPTPDGQEKIAKTPSSHLLAKVSQKPVENINATPPSLTKPPSLQTQVKYPLTPVERFNPTPDGQGMIAKTPSSHLLAKVSQKPVENINATPSSLTKSPSLQTQVKYPLTPVERFNPTPDKSQNITKAKTQTTPTLAQIAKTSSIERFNPTPDRPIIYPQRPVERLNPTPNRP